MGLLHWHLIGPSLALRAAATTTFFSFRAFLSHFGVEE
jgi:hypothetical protein